MNARAHSTKHHDSRRDDARLGAALATDGRGPREIFPPDERLTRVLVDYLH